MFIAKNQTTENQISIILCLQEGIIFVKKCVKKQDLRRIFRLKNRLKLDEFDQNVFFDAI